MSAARRQGSTGRGSAGSRSGTGRGAPAAPRGAPWLAGLRGEVAIQIVIGVLAAFLLCWNLGERYLWQDEAQTAVLGSRILRSGRPLAYDGKNFISVDLFVGEDAASIGRRTGDPRAAVDYYVGRGDLKPDTAWKYHPWGQYVVAALGLAVLGHGTLAARLPFALAGVAAVLLLYRLVRRECDSRLMASLAAVLLAVNPYWVLHDRQCRYYALSSLFLVLTLMGYTSWQRGRRWGAAAFVASVWGWFQADYGTVWPALGVLFLDAAWTHRRDLARPARLGAAVAVTLAPFVYYYEMWRRPLLQVGTWSGRFRGTLFNVNEYLVPLVVVAAALALLVWRRRTWGEPERRLITVGCAIVGALLVWVPSAAPFVFVRYVIVAAPLGACLAAWVLVRGAGSRASRLAWPGAAVLALTPWASMLLYPVAPPPPWLPGGALVRPELSVVGSAIFGHRPDPNRLVVEWLRQNAAPTDEILINYEDVPLMFYLPNPIRGGIAAFRVEDDAKAPPRFVVLRRSVDFVHWPVFRREVDRYAWLEVPLNAPDVFYGNNPDPRGQLQDPATAPPLYVARRVDEPRG
jgi:hypothetical protein